MASGLLEDGARVERPRGARTVLLVRQLTTPLQLAKENYNEAGGMLSQDLS